MTTSTKSKTSKKESIERPPVIAVMGHIDHGKSTLLDYIRESNVTEGESGGITQHISAYEVEHESPEQGVKKITFLDTPGHEAFRAVRARGAQVADIAILVTAADEGVKQQTLEALETIKKANLPYIVAINKIDKPEANVERAKLSLSEHGIYIEEYGGQIPAVPISAITGEGIDELLDMILLVAELEELKGDTDSKPSGVIIEANVDSRKGISATLVIKEGSLELGKFVVAGNAFAPIRIMENFMNESLQEATLSMPVRIVGFNRLPSIGSIFEVVSNKKEAENLARQNEANMAKVEAAVSSTDKEIVFPIILRADVSGSLEAIKHEMAKIESELVDIKIIDGGVGSINESDIKLVAGKEHSTVLGFNVPIDSGVSELAERMNVEVQTFDIIYRLTEWLEEKVKNITPLQDVEEEQGRAKILKTFSRTKDKQVVGGKVTQGILSKNAQVKIMRREEEMGRGVILELQSQKVKTEAIYEDSEFGTMIESDAEIREGDMIIAFKVVKK